MHSFLLLAKPVLRYRWTICGIFVSSMMVALMWGLNIGALFPVLKVSLEKQSLQAWVQEEIQKAESAKAEFEQELVTAETAETNRIRADIKGQVDAIRFYELVKPLVMRLPRDSFQTIMVIVLLLVVGTVIKGIFVFCNLMLVARIKERMTFHWRQDFFHSALKFDQSSFGEHRTSGLLSHFHADIGCVAGAVHSLSGTALREPLKMFACLIGASWISPRLLILSLILTPITAITIRRLAASIKRANRRSLEEVSSLYGVLTEAFQGIETVQAFSLERNQRNKFFGVAKACLQKTMRIAMYNALTKPVTELLGIGVIALALISGAYLTLNQQQYIGPIRMLDRPLDITSLLMFFSFLIGATEPARKLSDVFNQFQAGCAAAERLQPLLDSEPAIRDPANPQALPEKISSIQFSNVTFHYHVDAPVLLDVSLEVHAGETIAIVGPNGCGKTTLANLLPRFQDPISGSVLFDDTNVRDVRLRELRDRIGLVTQRSLLFDDTVYENIRQGKLNASQTDIVRAAKQAKADKFINEKLADGYDTIIGSGGSNLSGGQRQRLALARAMLRDPEILILDEATSQIDIESEQLIHQALEQFSKNRTMIIITHRLATLELADRIVVMDQGRIADVGTHADLMQRCTLYQRLHEAQFKRTA